MMHDELYRERRWEFLAVVQECDSQTESGVPWHGQISEETQMTGYEIAALAFIVCVFVSVRTCYLMELATNGDQTGLEDS